MDKVQPQITVIIPIYQHWELTETLFSALAKQTLPKSNWECLIVDNGSDVVPASESLPDFITLLECPQPGSYAARNRAIQDARGELLVFTDADCRPNPDWLEIIYSEYQSHSVPTLIAGGVTVLRFDHQKPNKIEAFDMATGLPQERYTRRGYAVTANLSVPRNIFSSVGPFDDQRFSGGDAEFCQRAGRAGVPLVYIPEANVDHPARNSWEELATKLKRVKGGQVRSGPLKRRMKFIIKTFIPPVWTYWFVISSPKITPLQKITSLLIQTQLWLVEIATTIKLLTSGKVERR
ncbi:glycosyltransferase family 2 protein [Alcanivorax sp.]|jgi:glycosyltransferase involved in cell wall biosynthesis|uniref:glycosyltransferase family 2 protein n=1 Tax=Alcanivorax sp. TaxID=1872427 RepID=UPI0032D95495